VTDARAGRGNAASLNVAVRLENVWFGYDEAAPIVRAASLDIGRGRTLALLGPNGCGKTTLLKLITGGLAAQTGRVEVLDRIAFVPQLTHVSFAYTALDMVLMGRVRQIGVFATPTSTDEGIASTALDRVGILALALRTFDTLSGGERQLVLFARALASEADILVLDEPTAALDLAHQHLVLQRIHQLARTDGMTIVFSTHQPDHAAVVADDVALMFRDRDIVTGPIRETMTAARLSQLFGIEVRQGSVRRDHGPAREVFVPMWNLDGDRP
jgi:iron complex transport system ATP-binding protein